MKNVLHSGPLFIIFLATFCLWTWTVHVIFATFMVYALVAFIPVYAKYAFLLLEHEADGRPNIPEFSMELFKPFTEMRYISFVFFVSTFAGLAVMVYDPETPIYTWLVIAAFVLIMPAVIIISVIAIEVIQIVNPHAWYIVIKRLGGMYFVMVAASLVAFGLIYASFGSDVGMFVTIFLALTLLYWFFVISGRFVHFHRNELGFQPVFSPERENEQEQFQLNKQRQRCLDQIYAQRKQQAAFGMLLNFIDNDSNTDSAFNWYLDQMLTWPVKKYAFRLACHQMTLLRADGYTAQADAIRAVCLNAAPEFSCDFD